MPAQAPGAKDRRQQLSTRRGLPLALGEDPQPWRRVWGWAAPPGMCLQTEASGMGPGPEPSHLPPLPHSPPQEGPVSPSVTYSSPKTISPQVQCPSSDPLSVSCLSQPPVFLPSRSSLSCSISVFCQGAFTAVSPSFPFLRHDLHCSSQLLLVSLCLPLWVPVPLSAPHLSSPL